MIRISVVIPTYHRTELLLRCIEALAAQDLEADDFEIIVVSDGPDHKTAETLRKRLGRSLNIRYYHLPENRGAASCRNYGWRQAWGDLVIFTEDDTIPGSQLLSSYLHLCGNASLAAFAGRINVPVPQYPTEHELQYKKLETAEFSAKNCACTKHALYTVDGFDERYTLNWREDTDLQFKLMKANIPIYTVPAAEVTFVVPEAHWGISVDSQKRRMFDALLYKNHPTYFRQKIKSEPGSTYYIAVFLIFFSVIAFLSSHGITAAITLIFWFYFVLQLTIDRLHRTSHTAQHITEMFFTSVFLPFASVYWHLYGLWKFRVWFI